jgi:hypothetical protein
MIKIPTDDTNPFFCRCGRSFGDHWTRDIHLRHCPEALDKAAFDLAASEAGEAAVVTDEQWESIKNGAMNRLIDNIKLGSHGPRHSVLPAGIEVTVGVDLAVEGSDFTAISPVPSSDDLILANELLAETTGADPESWGDDDACEVSVKELKRIESMSRCIRQPGPDEIEKSIPMPGLLAPIPDLPMVKSRPKVPQVILDRRAKDRKNARRRKAAKLAKKEREIRRIAALKCVPPPREKVCALTHIACGQIAFYYSEIPTALGRLSAGQMTMPDGSHPSIHKRVRCGSCGRPLSTLRTGVTKFDERKFSVRLVPSDRPFSSL